MKSLYNINIEFERMIDKNNIYIYLYKAQWPTLFLKYIIPRHIQIQIQIQNYLLYQSDIV